MPDIVTEGAHALEFLLSEANGRRSRENIIIDSSQTLKPGSVLGQKSLGGATVTAAAAVSGSGGTVGNGAISSLTADAGAPAGDYKIIITNPVTNAGAFEVFKPDGSLDGVGAVAVAYNGTINFTLADGSADWVEDDRIVVTVAYAVGSLRYVGVNPAAVDGSQHAAAILTDYVTTASGKTASAVGVVRAAEVISGRLDFGTLDSGQQTTALAELAAKGIVAR